MGAWIRARLVIAALATSGFGPTTATSTFLPPPPPTLSPEHQAEVLALLAKHQDEVNQQDPAQDALVRVAPDALCVTNGEIATISDGRMAINTPSSRAIVRVPSDPSVAEMRFRYIGPSPDAKPLASGEIRRQIGLKLHALDQCNLLYVMWRIEPKAELVVSIKRNPGQSTHEECGAHGYTNIKPQRTAKLAPMTPGESHTLRAELSSNDLSVYADNSLAWQGSLGSALDGLNGPPGLRTDNARFEFEYYIRPPSPGVPPTAFEAQSHCQRSAED
jgi:hypothetical protein